MNCKLGILFLLHLLLFVQSLKIDQHLGNSVVWQDACTGWPGEKMDTSFYYRLTTQWQGRGKSLDIINDGKNNKLQLAKTGYYTGQYWMLHPNPACPGWYVLGTKWTGNHKFLDSITGVKNSNEIWMGPPQFDSPQHWRFVKVGEYYRIQPMWPKGMAIDIVNDGVNNNHPQLRKIGNFSGQHWKLIKLWQI